MTTLQLQQCKVCTKRKFDLKIGLVCGLTMEKPTFIETCENGDLDEKEAKRVVNLAKEVEEDESNRGFFASEQKGLKKGVLGGFAMMAIAVIWFFVGLFALNRIFYYPPILFIIGIIGTIKGLAEGNYAGKK